MGVVATLTVNAAQASIVWGYQVAAALAPVTVSRDDDGWHVKGTVKSSDTYRLSQRPLVLEVSTQQGVWRWPVIELQMVDGACDGRLGPKESTDVQQVRSA